ncbi:MAG: dockerin type I repeat-containing protein, partial [Clostridia bacterium]|nr:dockerin type I repeat-containing protein [Clostridia bacterium]
LEAAKGHTPGAEADCVNAQTCTVCGEVLEAAKGHTPGAEADCENAQTCTVCGEVLEAAKGHTPGAAADCENAQICTECGEELNAALGHTHDHYEYDATHHWSICSKCESKFDEKAHSFDENNDCECGLKNVVVDAKPGMTYTVFGQTVTVESQLACKLGYLNGSKYEAVEAIKNSDGSYSFTAPEGVERVLLIINGDFDTDGDVDSNDATILAKSLLPSDHKEYASLNDAQLFIADINGNGKINSADKTLLARSLLDSTHKLYLPLSW